MGAITHSWISTVVSYNVQELILLGNIYEWSIPLPLSLFRYKSLVVLKLGDRFLINVPEYVSLPSLKTLYLHKAMFCGDDNLVGRLLSGSPVLEDFILNSCKLEKIEVFSVSSTSLKRFEIHNCSGFFELFVEIPNLKHFKFNRYDLRRCSGDAFKYLLEACILFGDHGAYFEKTRELVEKASNAQKLMLHGYVAGSPWPNFHALTSLDLFANNEYGRELLLVLLESAPCLETLILWHRFGNRVEQFPLPRVPVCFSMHLKTIQLNKFVGKDREFIMVEYILANAKVLEKLIICSYNIYGIHEKVSAFETYSKTCQIVTASRYEEEKQLSYQFDCEADFE